MPIVLAIWPCFGLILKTSGLIVGLIVVLAIGRVELVDMSVNR